MWADFSSETKRPKGGSTDVPTVSLSQGSQQRNTHIPLPTENLLDIQVPAAHARDSCIWHKVAHFAFVHVGNCPRSLCRAAPLSHRPQPLFSNQTSRHYESAVHLHLPSNHWPILGPAPAHWLPGKPPLLVVPQLTEILHYRTSKITSPLPSSLKTDLLVF